MTDFKIKGKFMVVCSWCNRILDVNNKPVRDAPLEHATMSNVSHGICDGCYARELERLEHLKAGMKR